MVSSRVEINDDPASMTLWVDGEPVPNKMGAEAATTVTYKWPKDSTTNSNLVGGFKEFGFGVRAWQNPMTGSIFITTTSLSEHPDRKVGQAHIRRG